MTSSSYVVPSEISRRMDYASLVAAMMILFIHGSLSTIPLPRSVDLLQVFIGDGICRVAVPFFLVRAGYFFFLNIRDVRTVFPRIKKRFKTLVIPYFFWAILGLLFLFAVSRISFLRPLIVRQYPWASLRQLAHFLLFDPINYQLWFLRDLFLLCLLSPVLFLFIRCFSWIGVVALGVIYIWFPCNYGIFYTNLSLFFFVLGGQLAMRNPEVIGRDLGRRQSLFLWFYGILLLVYSISKVFGFPLFSVPLKAFLQLPGIVCLWSVIGYFSRRGCLPLVSLSSFGFFIYLAHEPTITFLKKLILPVVPHTPFFLSFLYLSLPLLTLALVLPAAFFLKRKMPSFFSLIVGGR